MVWTHFEVWSRCAIPEALFIGWPRFRGAYRDTKVVADRIKAAVDLLIKEDQWW